MKEAMLYERLDGGRVHCYLCAHHCKIAESRLGFCEVRRNEGGALYSLVYGKLISTNVDPIEKKPLYHFLSHSSTYSIATIGCNFKCGYCQNWQISQIGGRDREIPYETVATPDQVVEEAEKCRCLSISYTYTEPTIFFEFAYDTAKRAREEGLKNVFVTNGYMSREALETIQPYLDAANVDLKSFRDEYYRKVCKAHLGPVLDSIRRMKELGIWVEITTLIVPGENDSEDELEDIVRFIAGLDPGIPWHISRFFPMYKYTHHRATPLETLNQAEEIGRSFGLKHIHLGNV